MAVATRNHDQSLVPKLVIAGTAFTALAMLIDFISARTAGARGVSAFLGIASAAVMVFAIVLLAKGKSS